MEGLEIAIGLRPARQISGDEDGPKPEVLLANAGLSYREIAEALDKNEQAVAKAVSRARNASKKGKTNE